MPLKTLSKLLSFKRSFPANLLFLLFYKEGFVNRILEYLIIVFRILELLFLKNY